jgi:hypothetical protein
MPELLVEVGTTVTVDQASCSMLMTKPKAASPLLVAAIGVAKVSSRYELLLVWAVRSA